MRKTITRKELDSKLRNLVKTSKIRHIVGVDVYSHSNSLDRLGCSWSNNFYGKTMKDDLFCFLMDKSLTHRILDVQAVRIVGELALSIVMILQDEEKPLKRTNIDGKTMRMLEKARYAS